MRNYEEVMVNSGAMRSKNNPEKPAGNNRGYKWQNIIKPIWEKYEKKPKQKAKRKKKRDKGSGFLPSDPNALCERLELLMASKQAGNRSLKRNY